MREVLTVLWAAVAVTLYLSGAPSWAIAPWVLGGVLFSQIPRERRGG